MDRWLNKLEITVGSSSSSIINKIECVPPAKTASLKRENSVSNIQCDASVSKIRKI